MPIELKDITDAVGGGGAVGGIVGLITTIGWYMRRERSEKAKTNADVSASNAQVSASDSQAKQIEALTKRVNEQGDMIISLMNEINVLKSRLASRDAARVGIKILLSSIKLCADCDARNQPILDEVMRLLKEDDENGR
jgi:hypothetical protein